MSKINFDEKYSTRIILLRHGQSLGNARRAYLGLTDLDLSERGYEQAEITGRYLADENIDAIYSSPLCRAYNTAVPHARCRGMKICVDTELREINLGDWENLTYDELISNYGELFTVEWRQKFGLFRAPGGDSVADVGERMASALKRIAAENEGKTVLVATHAAAIRAAWGKISRISLQELCAAVDFPANCSLTIVYFDGERLIPGAYSLTSHLEKPTFVVA